MLVKQKLQYLNRLWGQTKQRFSIGNWEFVYSDKEGFAKVHYHKPETSVTLYFCSHIISYPLHTIREQVVDQIPPEFVPCFALEMESTTVLVPVHRNVEFFI